MEERALLRLSALREMQKENNAQCSSPWVQVSHVSHSNDIAHHINFRLNLHTQFGFHSLELLRLPTPARTENVKTRKFRIPFQERDPVHAK